MKNLNRCKSIIIGLVYLVILYENIITVYIPQMGFWDEAITLFSIGVILYTFAKRNIKMDKNLVGATFSFGIFVLIGLLSAILHTELQPVMVARIKDLFAFSKMFFIIMGMNLFLDKQDGRKIIKVCSNVSKVAVIIMFICAGLEYSVGIGMSKGVRIIPCFSFLFSHVTFAVAAYVIIMTVFIADSAKKNLAFIIVDMMLIVFTMRSKGIAIIGIVILLLINKKFNIIAWIKRKGSGKVKFSKAFVAIIAFLGLFLMRDKIHDYLSWGMTAARTGLYIGGFILVKKYFPFGSGFGTFATFTSGKYYSQVYYDLGLQNVSGMTPTKYTYIADVFWPSIYGQTGLLGLVAYIAMLVFFIRFFIKRVDIKSWEFYGCVVIWLYALVASTAEAFFTNSSVAQFAVIFAVFCNVAKIQAKERKVIENNI